MTDPRKRQEILDAAQELRNLAHKVIKCAEDVAANPNDERLQRVLVDTQKVHHLSCEKTFLSLSISLSVYICLVLSIVS